MKRTRAGKPYGWGMEIVCGRKFCTGCGRWRHVCDFQCRHRGPDMLMTRCATCLRIATRRTMCKREVRERRREYQRIWTQTQRRVAGITPRNWRDGAHRVTESRLKQLDLEPFQKAYRESTMPTYELAARLGVDPRAVARTLGLVPRTHKDPKYAGLAKKISYENAVKIVLALDLDPVDFGV